MTFYDASGIWRCPDACSLLSDRDFEVLCMEEVERRINFKPVITDPGKPIDIAFIGLKAYRGDDYRFVVKLPNFYVWAQHESGFSKTMMPIMRIYCSAVKSAGIGPGSAYYTNYVKIVPPNAQFGPGGGPAAKAAMKNGDRLDEVCRELMGEELRALIANGCRLFMSFGVIASDYVQRAIETEFGTRIRFVGPKLVEFNSSDVRCLLARGPHFAARGPIHDESASLASAMCSRMKSIH